MDLATIMRLEELARAAFKVDHAEVWNGGEPFALVPAGIQIKDLEAFAEYRRRFRGTFSTKSVADFAAYVRRTLGGELSDDVLEGPPLPACFVNTETMQARIVFDLGDTARPGHGVHVAHVTETATPLWQALQAVDGKRQDQRGTVDFLQDWGGLWLAYDAELKEVSTPAALAAIRKIEIKASGGSTAEAGNMASSRSSFAKVEAETRAGLPAAIVFRGMLYPDLAARDVFFDVHVLPDEKAPQLVLRMRGRAALVEALAREFGDVVRAALTAGGCASVETLLGTFQ